MITLKENSANKKAVKRIYGGIGLVIGALFILAAEISAGGENIYSAQASEQKSANGVKAAPNGIKIPEDYKTWPVISVSHRDDHESLRVIIGNEIAVKAAREGKTNPWPKGTILGKVAWFYKKDENWEAATIPGKFSHAEFMIKDAVKYKATGGWGYARWVGLEQKPYGDDKEFAQECVACHEPVKARDYVFTTPVPWPGKK